MKKSQNPKKGLPCPVSGCPKVIYRGDYCYAHYMKNWRYGSPEPQHQEFLIDLSGQRFGALVILKYEHGGEWVARCDCGQVIRTRAGELNRGSKKSCGCGRHPRQDVVEYTAAHDRIRNALGHASKQRCVDNCGRAAQQWSYDHGDPDELVSEAGSSAGCVYSLKYEHYHPRCASCHRFYDQDHANAAQMQCLAT